MLSTVMTADDEDAVQRELAQLQTEAAPPVEESHVELPDAPEEEPVSQGAFLYLLIYLQTHLTHIRGTIAGFRARRTATSCAGGAMKSFDPIIKLLNIIDRGYVTLVTLLTV